jgi:adenylate cyclase
MKARNLVTLRFCILAIFIVTFVALISVIIFISSIFSSQSINHFSNALLQDKSTLILNDLKSKGNSLEIVSSITKFLFENGYIEEEQIVEYSFNIAKNTVYPQLKYPSRIVNWTDAEHNSITTFLEPNGTFSTTIIKPNAKPPIFTQIYRNHAGLAIYRKSISPNYQEDHVQYLPAIKAKHFIWTDAFISYPNKNLATAAVSPIYNKLGQYMGVFSLYISLEGVSNYLRTLTIGKNGISFLINGRNELIAFPGMQQWMDNEPEKTKLGALSSEGKPWIKDAIHYFNATGTKQFVYIHDHKRYIASFEALIEEIPEVIAYNWKIGIVVPESDFTRNLELNNIFMLLIGIVTLLVGIVLVSILSKRIAARIKLLVNETVEIKNFNFKTKKVKSIIKEVDSIASAIHSIKMNLRAFKKYLPAHLVRQLIESGEDVQIGGEKKTLSILFSDINNFTRITEISDSEQLMPQLCEYLDSMSKIIIETHGTIDKFIGDSVMAFWGAPLADPNHCVHACQAALFCKIKIEQINKAWVEQGKIPYITRFGVHTGEVIVGNIGSSERMNYTALGDGINLASRLEEMNKIYGTSIIVSEEVKRSVGSQFVFRKIDETTVKGKSGKYSIYELLAADYEDLSFDLQTYQQFFDEGLIAWQQEHWREAIEHFKNAQAVYPEDKITPVFITRCINAMMTAPSSHWDETWGD